MEKYIVGGVEFDNKTEAMYAEEDLKIVKEIIENNDLENPRVSKELYLEHKKNKTFKTKVGKKFLTILELNFSSRVPSPKPTKSQQTIINVVLAISCVYIIVAALLIFGVPTNTTAVLVFLSESLIWALLLFKCTDKMKSKKFIFIINTLYFVSMLANLSALKLLYSAPYAIGVYGVIIIFFNLSLCFYFYSKEKYKDLTF